MSLLAAALVTLTLSAHAGLPPLELRLTVRVEKGVDADVCLTLEGPESHWSCWRADGQRRTWDVRYVLHSDGEYEAWVELLTLRVSTPRQLILIGPNPARLRRAPAGR